MPQPNPIIATRQIMVYPAWDVREREHADGTFVPVMRNAPCVGYPVESMRDALLYVRPQEREDCELPPVARGYVDGCPECGGTPCYNLCSNSEFYYSPEQEALDSERYERGLA